MKLLIHIGTPKTGTTSIQAFLSSNRELQMANGFHYSRSLGEKNQRRIAIYSGAYEQVKDLSRRTGANSLEDSLALRKQIFEDFDNEVSSLEVNPFRHNI